MAREKFWEFDRIHVATTAKKAMKSMKAVKAMKAKKAMKGMRAIKKVSARLAKRHVFAGKTTKTRSGLSKGELVKNNRGKIVSKKNMTKGEKSAWVNAVTAARKALNITGF